MLGLLCTWPPELLSFCPSGLSLPPRPRGSSFHFWLRTSKSRLLQSHCKYQDEERWVFLQRSHSLWLEVTPIPERQEPQPDSWTGSGKLSQDVEGMDWVLRDK